MRGFFCKNVDNVETSMCGFHCCYTVTRAIADFIGVIVGLLVPCRWPKWRPTSMAQLVQVEQKILQSVRSSIYSRFVSLKESQSRLWTVILNKECEAVPLVMVHGMGGGLALWAQNMDELAQKRPVYMFDLLGFGRSSRPSFSQDPKIAEMEFVDSIEDWRKDVNLDRFILLGHSLGAFIASSYAIKYPDRVKHLILVDPWGFPEKPPDNEMENRFPRWIRVIATMLQPFNPLAGLRVAGPWGPGLIKWFRPDLQAKFSNLFDDDTIFEYIYHCNAQSPSGETAFKTMQMSFGWARNPMINRISDVPSAMPITFIHGSRSWIDRSVGYQVRYLRDGSYVDVQVILGAGHHVYADRPLQFNNVVKKICNAVDQSSKSARSDLNSSKDVPEDVVLDGGETPRTEPKPTPASANL